MSKKKDATKEKTPEDYVHDIQEACSHLGWCIAMNDRKNGISGLLIGNLKYLSIVISQLENSEDYEVWSKPSEENTQLH